MGRPKACPKADKATEADRRAQRFGKSAGELTDAEFGVALGVQGLLAGWSVNWLTHRLQCPLTVESLDGPVDVPPASREFVALMQELEKISRGGEPDRLKLMLDVMQQAGQGHVEDPKRLLLLALFDANDRNPKLPQTLTGIMRWMNSKHKGCCAGLGDLREVMRSLGLTATPDRSKSGKTRVDQAGKDLKGKALVTASLRARQPDLFPPRRKSRKTE